MFNVTNKALYAALAMVALTACSGSDKNLSDGMKLYNRADSALQAGSPQLCIQLLDSLDRHYKDDTDALHASILLRPAAIEAEALAEIVIADSTIQVNEAALMELVSQRKEIKLGELDPFFVFDEKFDDSFMNKTGISARVSDIGEFYIVSSVNPAGSLHHNSLTATAGNESVTSEQVPYDGALNYRISGGEVITFTPAKSDPIGAFIAAHADQPVAIVFNGESGGSKSVKLTAKQVQAVATAYEYAKAVNAMRDATILREKLERRLELARSKQVAHQEAHE